MAHLGDPQGHRQIEIVQSGEFGGPLRLGELRLVDGLHLVLAAVGRIDLLARCDAVATADPGGEGLREGEIVGDPDGRHEQTALGLVRLDPLERHDRGALDVAERVEDRAGAERHVRRPDVERHDHDDEDREHERERQDVATIHPARVAVGRRCPAPRPCCVAHGVPRPSDGVPRPIVMAYHAVFAMSVTTMPVPARAALYRWIHERHALRILESRRRPRPQEGRGFR